MNILVVFVNKKIFWVKYAFIAAVIPPLWAVHEFVFVESVMFQDSFLVREEIHFSSSQYAVVIRYGVT